ncbi:MAG: chromate efflux transporter, partial [Thermoanaerobaculia bacterium]
WACLGCVNFGGPAGQIAMMHRDLVVERKWIDEPRYLHALNFCSLLPGPEAQQLATYIGWTLHGLRGGLAAGILFVLPSIGVLLGLSWIYAAHGAVPAVAAVLAGVKAAVVAIILDAVLRIGKRALRTPLAAAIAIAAFAAVAGCIAFPWIVLGAGLIGAIGASGAIGGAGAFGAGGSVEASLPGEQEASSKGVVDGSSVPAGGAGGWRVARILASALLLWLAPLLLVLSLLGRENLAARLYLFFTQAAFVTFGGAYAVLAYVNQAAVTQFGWINAAQAVDGLGLAESTPGPLIMVLQFVGFMAGWQAPPAGFSPAASAILCAFLTSWATFLPSLTFVLLGAPYIDRLRHVRALSGALAAILAAVTGVILHLGLTFGRNVLFPNGFSQAPELLLTAVALAALLVLRATKISPALLVLGGALIGLVLTGWSQ